jgi:hypothetical protein
MNMKLGEDGEMFKEDGILECDVGLQLMGKYVTIYGRR